MGREHLPAHKQLNTNLTLITMRKKSDCSQRAQVKQWLESGNEITPIQALEMFGAFRLGAIVHALKRDEHLKIHTTMVYLKNGKRFAKYKLIE